MADGLETRLREEFRRVDAPPAPGLDGVAARAGRLRRRRVGTTVVVALVVSAGLILPLATLGRFGSEPRKDEQQPGGPVHAADLSVDVPDGWDSALSSDYAGDLWLVVTSFPIPGDPGLDEGQPSWSGSMPPDGAMLVVAERTAQIVPPDVDVGGSAAYRDEDFVPVDGPVVLRSQDFGARFEGTPPEHSVALRDVRIDGVPLTVYAEFGDDPAPSDLLDQVNEILGTLRVTATEEETTRVVEGDGLSAQIPSGWDGRFQISASALVAGALQVASLPIEEPGTPLAATRKGLGPDDVVMEIFDYTPGVPGRGGSWDDFPPLDGPPAIGREDLGVPVEGEDPQTQDVGVINFRLNGRALVVVATFGTKPATEDVLAQVNEVLATLDVATGHVATIGTPPGEGVEGWMPASFQPADSWYTATTGRVDPDLFSTPVVWSSTIPFAQEDLDQAREAGTLGYFPRSTLEALPPDGVVVIAALSGQDTWPNGPDRNAPEASLPLSLSEADVRGNWEGQPADNVPEYVLWRTVDGFRLDARVYFGTQNPSEDTLAAAQAQLARLTLPGPPEIRDLTIHTDADDGVSIAVPSGWSFHRDPTPDLAEPRILFAAGSWQWPYPMHDVCGPAPALEEMPADGAFLWLLEHGSLDGAPEPEGDFPARPAHFSLDGLDPVIPECSAVEGIEQYIVRFSESGRSFQLQLAFGPDATDERRGEVLAAMDDFEVTAPIPTTCPHDFGPWSDADCPEPAWVRAVAEELGFEVVGDTGSALILDAAGKDVYLWANLAPEDFAIEDDTSLRWWRGFGTDVYFDGNRLAWFDGDWDLLVWMEGDVEGLPSEAVIEDIVRASLSVNYDSIDTRN